MNRILLAYALVGLTAGGPLPNPSPSDAASITPGCPELSVTSEFQCVELTVRDNSIHHAFVEVDWGDGDVVWFDTFLGSGGFPHTYADSGTYHIFVTAPSSCGGGGSAINSISVDVESAPTFDLMAVKLGTRIMPATGDAIQPERIQKSIVVWGDGTPVEEFQWVDCLGPGNLCTPDHLYASAGTYVISVLNEYGPDNFGCSSKRGSLLTVAVDAPTPVKPSTWGSVKALYQ